MPVFWAVPHIINKGEGKKLETLKKVKGHQAHKKLKASKDYLQKI